MKKIKIMALTFMLLSFSKLYAQSDPYLGQIIWVPYNYTPRGWMQCNGQILKIVPNSALFSLIGTQFGGDGSTTFALPNLNGRAILFDGPDNIVGTKQGEETHSLSISEMPTHNHLINAVQEEGNTNLPTNNYPANTKTLDKEYSNTTTSLTTMNANMLSIVGSGQPHENRQPYLAMKCIIAIQGTYPARN